ncbi:MAG: hypothetical protein ABW005_12485 [Burkholderiaceae bacterium]
MAALAGLLLAGSPPLARAQGATPSPAAAAAASAAASAAPATSAASRPLAARPPAVREAVNAGPPAAVKPVVPQISIPLSRKVERPASIRTSKIPPVGGSIDDGAARCLAASSPGDRAACQSAPPAPPRAAEPKR